MFVKSENESTSNRARVRHTLNHIILLRDVIQSEITHFSIFGKTDEHAFVHGSTVLEVNRLYHIVIHVIVLVSPTRMMRSATRFEDMRESIGIMSHDFGAIIVIVDIDPIFAEHVEVRAFENFFAQFFPNFCFLLHIWWNLRKNC